MELVDRFRQEYKARFRQELGDYMDDLGFDLVVFRLFLDGKTEDLAVEGPGLSHNGMGYRKLQIILKDMEQKYNVKVVMERKRW